MAVPPGCGLQRVTALRRTLPKPTGAGYRRVRLLRKRSKRSAVMMTNLRPGKQSRVCYKYSFCGRGCVSSVVLFGCCGVRVFTLHVSCRDWRLRPRWHRNIALRLFCQFSRKNENRQRARVTTAQYKKGTASSNPCRLGCPCWSIGRFRGR